MSYPINYPTPQGADVQIFYRTQDWVKPQGASFVWFTLIGPGGGGNTTNGGGSGAVTNFMCPAFLIPDQLRVSVGSGGTTGVGTATEVIYQQKNTTGYTLLTASSGQAGTGATAMSANFFTAMGFFQSIAGQNGNSGAITASTTTFLGGGGGSGQAQTANYGYSPSGTGNRSGIFQLSPIIVGLGGMGTGSGGVGCGGGVNSGRGGNGLVVIITW